MDRDRRPRDIPPEDQFGNGRGQSYRPGKARERTPPRMDSYRARSPPRRGDYIDSYRAPRGRSRSPPLPPPMRDDFRRRSPSPRYRDHDLRGGDSYRAPPPRRDELPRDDLFRREPARDPRDYPRNFRDDNRDRGFPPPGRSPLPRFRDRSPLPLKRGRDPSPMSSRGRRTPPLPKRERLGSPPRGRYDDFPPSRGASPPRRFTPDARDRQWTPPRNALRDSRPRSRSPPLRNDRFEPRHVDDRRRAVTPARELRHELVNRDRSGHDSGATSRRSSPPIHPSRASLQQAAAEEKVFSNRGSPRGLVDRANTPRAQPSEPKRLDAPNTPQPPAKAPPKEGDSAPTDRDRERVPPREPRRADDAAPVTPRAPPTGPAGQRSAPTSVNPPTGPATATRTPTVPPSGPRGATSSRGDFSGRGRGGFGTDFTPRGRGGSFGLSYRGGRGGTPTGPSFGRSEAAQQEPASSSRTPAAPPSGPRASMIPQGPAASYRQPNVASPSPFARTQRFGPNGEPIPEPAAGGPPTGPKASRRLHDQAAHSNFPAPNRPHPALADLPQIIEGGKKAEPLVDRTKITTLEDEAEKLRKQLDEKEARIRKSLREWDRLTRDTEAAALRSELAETALRHLNGETELQAAF